MDGKLFFIHGSWLLYWADCFKHKLQINILASREFCVSRLLQQCSFKMQACLNKQRGVYTAIFLLLIWPRKHFPLIFHLIAEMRIGY